MLSTAARINLLRAEPRSAAMRGLKNASQSNDPPYVKQITVHELQDLFGHSSEKRPQFIDVREEWEFSLAALPHFRLYPLSAFHDWGSRASEILDRDRPIVVLCHHGVRSNHVAHILHDRLAFHGVSNVIGGIDAYSQCIDPGVPRY